MKHFALFATLGAAVVPWVGAQPADTSAPSWSFSLTPAVVSQYMFRGVRYGGLSFQPTLEADGGNFAIGVWGNQPLRDKVPGVSDPEIDPYATYTLRLTDALNLQPTLYLYTYPRADVGQGDFRSSFEPNLALNYTWRGVRFTPKLYYDVVLEGPTWEGNVSTAVALPDLGTELDFLATAGTFSQGNVVNGAAPKVKNWGDYWYIGVTLPFAVSRSAKVSVGLAYTRGSRNYFKQGAAPRWANDAAGDRAVFSLSGSWTF